MKDGKIYLISSALAAVLGASSAVCAGEGDSYFGFGLGSVSPDNSVYDSMMGWKLFGGYSVSRYLALEAGYISFGKMDGPVMPNGEIKAVSSSGLEFSAIGSYPFADKFAVFGKLGFLVWDSKWSNSGPTGGMVTTGDVDLFYGLGGRFDLSSSIGFLGAWERYSLDDEIDVLTASIVYSF